MLFAHAGHSHTNTPEWAWWVTGLTVALGLAVFLTIRARNKRREGDL